MACNGKRDVVNPKRRSRFYNRGVSIMGGKVGLSLTGILDIGYSILAELKLPQTCIRLQQRIPLITTLDTAISVWISRHGLVW